MVEKKKSARGKSAKPEAETDDPAADLSDATTGAPTESETTEATELKEPVADTEFVPEGKEMPIDEPVTEETAPEPTQSTAAEEPVADTGFVPDGEKLPEEQPETAATVAPETVEAAPEPVVAERAPQTGSMFWPALLGGVIAAILGFVVAQTDLLSPILPESWREDDRAVQEIEKLGDQLAAQAQTIEGVSSKVAAISVPDLAPVNARIDDISAKLEPLGTQIGQLSTNLGDLETRLTALEKRPLNEGVSQSAIDAYERELDRLKQSVADQRAQVEKVIAEARELDSQSAEAARQAAAQTALARVQTALEDGTPFAPATDALTAAEVTVPDVLAKSAGDGVVTLAQLQTTFPPAARAALADVRDSTAGSGEGFSAFLQRQLGARSVAPREGDDPDAVLSRAQAAVTGGDLKQALAEISTLPEAAQPAMADWVAQAQQRVAALDAAGELAQTLAPK